MTSRMALAAMLLGVSGLGSGTVSAATIAYENFDLPAGSNALAGSAGAGSFGFSSNWVAIDNQPSGGNVVSPGYSFGSLATSGNRAQIFNAAATSDTTAAYFYRTLDTPFAVATNSSGTLWGSFLIQGTAAASGGMAAVIGLAGSAAPTVNDGVITIGAIGGNTNYRAAHRALDTSGSGVVSTTATSAGTLAFAVVKLTINTNPGAAESISLWLNPDLASFDGSESSLGTAALAGVSLGNVGIDAIRSIAFGSNYTNTQNPTLGLDEIRLGTSAADAVVVPEPSVVGGLVMGVILAAGTRRRRDR